MLSRILGRDDEMTTRNISGTPGGVTSTVTVRGNFGTSSCTVHHGCGYCRCPHCGRGGPPTRWYPWPTYPNVWYGPNAGPYATVTA